MRIFEIKGGSIDVRREPNGDRVCLVFESKDMNVKLFRTMCAEEFKAFCEHLDRVRNR